MMNELLPNSASQSPWLGQELRRIINRRGCVDPLKPARWRMPAFDCGVVEPINEAFEGTSPGPA